MNTSFGPWATAIHVDNQPQLSAFWKRRLEMLTRLNKNSHKISRGRLLGVAILAGLAVGLPTMSLVPALGQHPVSAPGAGKSEEADSASGTAGPSDQRLDALEKQIETLLQDVQALQRTKAKKDEKAEGSQDSRDADAVQADDVSLADQRLSSALPGLSLQTGSANSLDLIHLANSYIEAKANKETAEALYAQLKRLAERNVVSGRELEEAAGSYRAARLRAFLLREILKVALDGARTELETLREQSNFVAAQHEAGHVDTGEVLQARHNVAQAQTRVRILELILKRAE